MCSSGLEALSCPFSTKFLRSTDLRFTILTAIATYPLLPPSAFILSYNDVLSSAWFYLLIAPYHR